MAVQKKSDPAARARRAKLRRKRKIRRIAWRAALSVLTVLVLLVAALYCAGWVAFRGPSETMGDLLTVTMLETSALKFIPHLYYSSAQVDAILARNQVSEVQEATDTSLIVIAPPTPEPTPIPNDAQVTALPDLQALTTPEPTQEPVRTMEGIEVYDVKGGTYTGYMMVVHDP